MKGYSIKILVSIAILIVGVPVVLSAHELGEEFEKLRGNGPGMMRFLEDEAVGTARHEEMEALMEKMMSGKLTEEEAETVVTYMRSYPGVYGQMVGRMGMMGRMGGGVGSGSAIGPSMMGWWGNGVVGAFSFLGPLTMVIWLIAGIALVAFLFRKLNTPSGSERREH